MLMLLRAYISFIVDDVVMGKKAIIIGASSGIGLALARLLSKEGYELGLTARRFELLQQLQKELNSKTYLKQLDVTHISEAMRQLENLLDEMQDVDLIVINAGVFLNNMDFDWEKEKRTVEVNVMGFCVMANVAMKYFVKMGKGHIVGISSISALRGETCSPAYSASKAFVSNYLEGLRVKGFKRDKHIFVTDIQPGWVDTDMAKGEETFWMASPEEAAKYIYKAIKNKRRQAYITPRWRLYAWFLKLMPRWAYDRFF